MNQEQICFNALTGLNCYEDEALESLSPITFQCPLGLELLREVQQETFLSQWRFNALSGLNCYGKNAQYFKFFMILFMHTCYL